MVLSQWQSRRGPILRWKCGVAWWRSWNEGVWFEEDWELSLGVKECYSVVAPLSIFKRKDSWIIYPALSPQSRQWSTRTFSPVGYSESILSSRLRHLSKFEGPKNFPTHVKSKWVRVSSFSSQDRRLVPSSDVVELWCRTSLGMHLPRIISENLRGCRRFGANGDIRPFLAWEKWFGRAPFNIGEKQGKWDSGHGNSEMPVKQKYWKEKAMINVRSIPTILQLCTDGMAATNAASPSNPFETSKFLKRRRASGLSWVQAGLNTNTELNLEKVRKLISPQISPLGQLPCLAGHSLQRTQRELCAVRCGLEFLKQDIWDCLEIWEQDSQNAQSH